MDELFELPDPGALGRRLLAGGGRLLVAGAMGTGKSTLVERMADAVAAELGACRVLTADLGQPLLGPPGAAALGERRDGRWRLHGIAGVASLDAARFRLPLLEAVRRLARRAPSGPLLVDAPGIFRGMAAGELLSALVTAAAVSRVLMLVRGEHDAALLDDLRAAGAEVELYRAPAAAAPGGQRQRVARRNAAWRQWLETATRVVLDLHGLSVTGAPPPRAAAAAWRGRQVVVLDGSGETIGMGEVVELADSSVVITAPPFALDGAAAIVVRDARRGEDGVLRTAARVTAEPDVTGSWETRAPIELPPPRGRCLTGLRGTLVGGLLGDPMLLLREVGSGRHLLLDLGEHFDLPARVAHRTSDVFLTHGHLDHLAGFVWLLRRRIGLDETCRIWGPPGTAEAVHALVRAVTWDRIGEEGPRFEIAELEGDRLRRWALQAGCGGLREMPEESVRGGVIRREGHLEVRAATLEHGTPVLAYALQEGRSFAVRPDRMEAHGLPPGPWVGRMKGLLEEGRAQDPVALPDGREVPAGELATDLVEERPGQKLVYACDLADCPGNRRALVALAEGAQLLVCEAAFAEADRERALATGHLTARACGEIATAAGVDRLLPFHLSARYQERPQEVLGELRAAFDRMWLPRTLRHLVERELAGDEHDLEG